jgi:hypothetical protein
MDPAIERDPSMAQIDLHRLKVRAMALGLLGLAVPILSACTSLGPFEGPQPSADEHALCYTRLATTPEQLQTTARNACGGGEPHVVKQASDFSACPLLTPMRLYFTCGAA